MGKRKTSQTTTCEPPVPRRPRGLKLPVAPAPAAPHQPIPDYHLQPTPRSPATANYPWEKFSDEKLLDMRICDLQLDIEKSMMVRMRNQLYGELERRGLRLRPHFWLSDEWFVPDGVPGIAIPFYMAHPRLMRLERKQMLEVEGGAQAWCMRILRHEAGHAIDIAYRMNRRKRYREMFGRYSDPYPEYYRPKPRSKNFVLHLEPWYAQSHPAEDFAETFAVWLQSKSKTRWQKEYRGWKALEKIRFVDELMEGQVGVKPPVASRAKIDPVHRMKHTLREHYQDRHARYDINYPTSFDQDLKKLFAQPSQTRKIKKAATFLQRHREEFCRGVAEWTGEYRYNINQVIRVMIERCRAMDLRIAVPEEELKRDTLMMLTVHTMNYLYRGNHRVAL